MHNLFVDEIELPQHINAVTVKYNQVDYAVYINAALTEEDKLQAILHEAFHLVRKHFHARHYAAVEPSQRRKMYRD